MADKKQFDLAGDEPSDLDPFAELMGFDPREPVAPRTKPGSVNEETLLESLNAVDQASAAVVTNSDATRMARDIQADSASAEMLDDDFGIDLERELLGDLLAASDPVEIPAAPVSPAFDAAPVDEGHFDAALVDETAELEAAFAGQFSDEEDEADFDGESDADFDALNAAFAETEVEAAAPTGHPADLESLHGAVALAEADAVSADDFDFDELDFGDIDAAIGHEIEQSLQKAAIAPAEQFAGSSDADLAADLEDAFAYNDDAVASVNPAPMHQQPQAAASLADDGLDFDPGVDWSMLDDNGSTAKAVSSAPTKSAFEIEAEQLIAALDAAAAKTTLNSPGLEGQTPAASIPEQVSALEKMADRYQSPDIHDTWRQTARPQHAYADAPEVDTTELFDQAYSMADDLDLPEVAYDEPSSVPNPIDLEFDNLLNEMSRGEAPRSRPIAASSYDAPSYEPRAPMAPRAAQSADDFGFDSVFGQNEIDSGPQHQNLGEFDFENDLEDDDPLPQPPPYRGAARRNGGRGMMIAAIVGGIAVLGGLGAAAMSWNDQSGGAPVILKADSAPVKVRPENPGGTTVAHSDSTVYDAVSGAAEKPAQKRLVSSTEEPMALPQPDDYEGDDVAAMVKGEDRIEPGAADEATKEQIAVAPRKVRTVIVKPDGTLAPAPQAPAEAGPAVEEPTDDIAAATDQDPEQITTGATSVESPSPETVASVPSGWAVQVASQPSEDGANKSLRNISKRYGKVIGERSASIVKAEVAGKGTYWRVRIVASSRDDAVNLCSNLKSAGGSCFVTR
jgi:hypothetical protein